MDRLTSLTVFVRVVDSAGFTAAGRRLNMSTTMVSSHVQALEDRLGARLLRQDRLPPPYHEAPIDVWGQSREAWRRCRA